MPSSRRATLPPEPESRGERIDELDPRDVLDWSDHAAALMRVRSEAADAVAGSIPAGTVFHGLTMQPREMWGWGEGYGFCGECAFQEALLYFGNYVSQHWLRLAAGNTELLIGEHDPAVAEACGLDYECFDGERVLGKKGEAFLDWTFRHVEAGCPVIAGWYRFDPNGDAGYDHIMPVSGVFTRIVGGKEAVVGVEFHDLARAGPRAVARAEGDDGVLLARRSETLREEWAPAGEGAEADEQRYKYALPREAAYGVALTGNTDAAGEAERFVLSVGRWDEPDWSAEDGAGEAAAELTASGVASGLRAGQRYALLRFDRPEDVPRRGGLLRSGAWARAYVFEAPGEVVALRRFDKLRSDGAYFFRLVAVPDDLVATGKARAESPKKKKQQQAASQWAEPASDPPVSSVYGDRPVATGQPQGCAEGCTMKCVIM